MSLLQTIKPFWPILLTFVLPRLISFSRSIRVAIRTRPQPTPAPASTRTALNVLFLSITVFLALSIQPSLIPGTDNIFTTTSSRFSLSTDALFARLALARSSSHGGLTPPDEALRSKFTTRTARELYLRFGPQTLLDCAFCDKDDSLSYTLYFLPGNVLVIHLLHFLAMGVATSESVGGWQTKRWRTWCLLGSAGLVAADLFLVLGLEMKVDASSRQPPVGMFWVMRILRPIFICVFDALVAGVVWASATNRLISLGGGSVDNETVRRKNMELLGRSTLQLQTAQTKLRAANVVTNAVVRDRVLREVEDGYWRQVREVEGREGLLGGMEGVWEDEDVQSAMAQAYGQGSIDVRRMRSEAEGFVRAVTGHLDSGTGR